MLFVTGCARSGTSLTMALLEACGANLGVTNGLNEIKALRDDTVKPYLKRINADPKGQYPLPDLEDIQPDAKWREKVLSAVGEADAAKIIKGVLIWPLFVEHFPEAKWLIVMREREHIARSCMRTSFMTAYGNHTAWMQWAQFYHERCAELAEHVESRTVWPDKVINGDYQHFADAVEWAGFTWNDKALNVIRRDKWHQ